MNADAALEAFIDSKIPHGLRENYSRDVSLLRAGWRAAMKYRDSQPASNDSPTPSEPKP